MLDSLSHVKLIVIIQMVLVKQGIIAGCQRRNRSFGCFLALALLRSRSFVVVSQAVVV